MIVKYSPNIAWQKFFNTVYIFDEINHKTFIITDIAMQFWMTLQRLDNFKEICIELSKYHTSIIYVDLEQDFKEFIEELERNNLIIIEDN